MPESIESAQSVGSAADAVLAALQGAGPLDLLDVLVATALFYGALRQLRRSQSALVAVGAALIAALYAGGRALDLALTVNVLHGFAGAGVLVAAIVFQEELRQAFEELAAWALGRRDDHRPRLDTAEVLSGALVDLAREKIGALVVIPGIQRLDRLTQGGHALDGELSEPLLKSLFDAHSAGHDGAVIVEDRRVARFGVHLPLARNPAQLAGAGTRHSAALGLSERSDALCLVVSEERGTLTAALGGTLHALAGERELESLLLQFYRQRRSLAPRGPRFARAVRERWVEKALWLAVAAALWLAVRVS
jgi:DNA integrity scanning protein DisA with diadenylate cyclase activity